jgi:excisionase family DNA binding protein
MTMPGLDPPTAGTVSDSRASGRDDDLRDLLTVADVAAILKVNKSWVYEHTRDEAEDRLPFVKLGKYLRFDRTDLRAYVAAKRASSRTARRRR